MSSDVDGLSEDEAERLQELHEKEFDDLTDKEATSRAKLSLKRRFSKPEWVLNFEVAGKNGRRADGVAVNTFPSRNFKIVGFEIKASRSDWLSEKREGAKADYFVQIVDEWYVVAARTGIVKEEELPDGWGLLELKPNSERLYKEVESQLTDHQQGEPDRHFWATFLRKEDVETDGFSEADLAAARQRGYEQAKEEVNLEERTEVEMERLQEKAEKFDELRDLGLPVSRFADEKQMDRLDKAYWLVGQLKLNKFGTLRNRVEFTREKVESDMEDAIEKLDEIEAVIDDLAEELDGGDDA